MRAETNDSNDGQGAMPSEDDRAEYVGWIIDDFPGTAEQVLQSAHSLSHSHVVASGVMPRAIPVFCNFM